MENLNGVDVTTFAEPKFSTEEMQKLKEQRIATFKKSIESMIATSADALKKSNSREGSKGRFRQDYTKEEIHRIVTEGSAVEKAILSKHFFSVSGLYKRIILHYATFLTYSWTLVPHMKKMGAKLKEKSNAKIYFEAAEFCSNFGIERKSAVFAKDVLVCGGYYGIIHDSGTSVAIQDLPFEYCRSRFKNQQDVDIVEFDMRFFDKEIPDENLREQILKTFPKVVQKGYKAYKNGKDPWIFLPAELGIYFCLFEESPFFLDLIPLIDDLEDYKEINKERNLLALKRIITQEIPHDGLNLVFEPEEAQEMHEGVLEMIANNPDADVITSYGKVNMLDLSGDVGERTDVEIAQQLIYDSAGVSKELFSASNESGLNFSLNNDLSMMMILGKKFGHFFTALLNNKFGNKKLSFKLLILPVSFYNAYEYTSKAKDLAAFGYSFLMPIVATGIDQTSLADLKELENDVLDLDEVLKPLQSAYTQSGKTNAITAKAGDASNDSGSGSTAKKDEDEKEKKESKSSDDNKADKKSDTAAEKKGDGGENK